MWLKHKLNRLAYWHKLLPMGQQPRNFGYLRRDQQVESRSRYCFMLYRRSASALIDSPEHFYREVGTGIIRPNLDNRACKPISILSCYGEPCDVQPVRPVRYLDILYLIIVQPQ